MKKAIIILLAILLCWNVGFAEEIVIDKIDIIGSDSIELKIGDNSQQLEYKIVPTEATDTIITWTSDDTNIADVVDGLVTAIAEGTTTITATNNDKVAMWTITVMESPNNASMGGSTQSGDDKSPFEILFYGFAVLTLIVLILLVYMLSIVNSKKRFRNNVLDLLVTEEEGTEEARMGDFIDRIVKKAQSSIPPPPNQPAKSDEEKLKEMVTSIVREILSQNHQNQEAVDEPKPQPTVHVQPQPQSLYADFIIDGKFSKVTEQPANNSIFELKLAKAGDTQANVVIYSAAYERVIANPSFLEGCEKQITGNTNVAMQREGIAQKDGSGKWIITTIPEILIS
jgi:hypothetical protein